MSTDWTEGVVRILTPNGQTVGTGFVITTDGLIATCAHVVEAAGGRPGGTVDIVLHVTHDVYQAHVEPDGWRDPAAEDVALLRLEAPPPAGVIPLPLGSSTGTNHHLFETFGFPSVSPDEGLRGRGSILGEITLGGVRVLQLRSQEVTPGFSGAPLWDQTTQRVVGIVTAITPQEEHGRLAETAFGTPSETLRDIYPHLRPSDLCPYQGLAAFSAAEAEFFFGREALINDLIEHLRRNPRLLAVVGPSGSGKSSLVQAGLLPALHGGKVPGSEHWYWFPFRPGADPFAALAAAGLEVTSADDLRTAVQTFRDGHPEVRRVTLFADQFETLFALCPAELQERFIRGLLAVLASDLPVTLIFTVRADFYGHLLRYSSLVEWLNVGQVNVPPMGAPELRAAIEKPAERVGLRFEAGLIEVLLEEAGQVEHVLPLLEAALTQLWAQRVEGSLTHAAYQTIGRIAGAIGQWAEDTYSRLSIDQQQLARRLFTRLVHYGEHEGDDTRRQWTLERLAAHPEERDRTHSLVRQLADARLLVTDRKLRPGEETEETVEIIHDALLWEWERLKQWRKNDRDFYVWRQRLSERQQEYEKADQDKGALLRGAQLAEAEQWLQTQADDLNHTEQAYIQASQAERRRRRRAVIGVALLFLAFVYGGVWLRAVEQGRAEQQRNTALRVQSRRLADLSLQQTAVGDATTGILLALEALPTDMSKPQRPYVAQAEAALYQALLAPQVTAVLKGHKGPVRYVAFSSDGQRLVSASSDGTARLWNPGKATEIAVLNGHKGAVRYATFSPDGSRLVTVSEDGTAQLWNARDGTRIVVLRGHEGPIEHAAFSPDGRCFVSVSRDRTARVWDVHSSTEPMVLRGHTGTVEYAAFSPDGHYLATASSDMTGRLWDVDTGTEIAILRGHKDVVRRVAFRPQGDQLLTASSDGTIRVWHATDGEKITELRAHQGPITHVAYSPDGQRLVSSSEDGTVRLWDASLSTEPTIMRGHRGWVEHAAFSPDGQHLVTASSDRTARVWDVKQGVEMAVLSCNVQALVSRMLVDIMTSKRVSRRFLFGSTAGSGAS